MIRFLVTFIASWSISSWILTEAFFFAPEAEPVVVMLQEVFTIPRHDKWNLGGVSEEIGWLQSKLSDVKPSKAVPIKPFLKLTTYKKRTNRHRSSGSSDDFVWDSFGSSGGLSSF